MSSLSKRKHDDYASDDALLPLNPTRMRKDQNSLPSHPQSSAAFPHSRTSLQFFVRILSDYTVVLHADEKDTVRSVHERIQLATGIPLMEQRLIYRGKQLQLEQTLDECKVENDSGLHLVGRMRSTRHRQAWQLMNDIISLIIHLIKHNSQPPWLKETVKSMMFDFITITPLEVAHDRTSGHLQIFMEASAPTALVMLYLSSNKPNKEAAEDAIKHFISSCKTALAETMHHDCVPIILEFCKLLKRAMGINDPLYCFCRNSLGAMVEYIEFREEDSVGFHEIFPFINEIADKLSRDLELITGSSSSPGPSLNDVNDFSAFMAPVRNEIRKIVHCCGPIRIPLTDQLRRLSVCYEDEILSLHKIYIDMLSKIDKGLLKIQDHVNLLEKRDVEYLSIGSCNYLSILRELNYISKLYNGHEALFWDTMKKKKDALCYIIINYAKRGEVHKWILDCKEVTSFEARRHLAMMILPEVKNEYEELHEMLIDRSQLLEESFEYILHAEPESLRAGLFMEFKNEEATGPGVLREWFLLVCQAIFNPQNALFVPCPNDRRRFFPNPVSGVNPKHLKYFTFAGKVIALALMNKIQIGIVFDRVFFLQLAGRAISLEDIKDVDPYLYNSCKQILEMDPEAIDQDALGLTFVYESEELGTRKEIELCPDGKNIVVSSKNRVIYVQSLIHQRFVKAVSTQVSTFARGLEDIMGFPSVRNSFFECLELEDLDGMLYGSEKAISVDDWKAHTEYHGFKETDAQISWFWQIVGNMTAEQRKVLLFFWSSIKYLPFEGFRGLSSRLYIYKICESSDHLPSSHTCFFRLCFPAYPTRDVMQDRLKIITREHVGCSFGTW